MSKIILIGDPESGKTALLNCLLAKPFNSTYTKTTRTNHQKKFIDDVQYCISDTPSV
jgi:GTPase SAR1 family protein